MKFECSVERKDKYVIELDETFFTEEWMDGFRGHFFDYYTLDEHAEHIAQHRARYGRDHIEGYGIPLENGKVPYWADEKEVNKAINIKILSEDEDIDTYTFEV